MSKPYRGRFAPSPSGPLHFGSLVAALGSWLQARRQHGQWLLRIEDIDPPREVAGASQLIQQQLLAHGLYWDEEVSFQSKHSARYEAALAQLQQQGLAYYCQCTRAQIKQIGGHYLGHCRDLGLGAGQHALRFLNLQPVMQFTDGHVAVVKADASYAGEDFILKRKDGLYAYHLASVVDDFAQGITEVVRGADLLQPTACQLALYRALGYQAPAYLHLPVVVTSPGQKLSKQNHAPAIESADAKHNIVAALACLGLTLDNKYAALSLPELLHYACEHWHPSMLQSGAEIQQPQ